MRKRLSVLSVPIDVITMKETIQRVQELMNEPGLHHVVTANAEMVMLAKGNPILYSILEDASIVTPDGAGVLWAAEQNNELLPERVTGIDVTRELFSIASKQNIPVYCLGAAPGVAKRAVENLEREVGPLQIVGIHDGFFNTDEEQSIIGDMAKAKLIFVALGVPKQEIWIKEHLSHLSGVVAVGIGGSFDVIAGNIPRAPEWMQNNRLEWL